MGPSRSFTPVVPELELLIAKNLEQPSPSWLRRGQVGYLQLHVLEQAHASVRAGHQAEATELLNLAMQLEHRI